MTIYGDCGKTVGNYKHNITGLRVELCGRFWAESAAKARIAKVCGPVMRCASQHLRRKIALT
jgi:hypothetical protein